MFDRTRSSVLLLLVCLLPVDGALAAGFEDVPGVWQMRGYGRILAISADELARYDITDIRCIRDRRLDLAEANQKYDRLSPDGDRLTLFESGGITRYEFVRLASLPERASC